MYDEEFYIAVRHKGEVGIGHIYKEEKWYEDTIDGEIYNFGSKNYMSYLTPDDIMNWLEGDYDEVVILEDFDPSSAYDMEDLI